MGGYLQRVFKKDSLDSKFKPNEQSSELFSVVPRNCFSHIFMLTFPYHYNLLNEAKQVV